MGIYRNLGNSIGVRENLNVNLSTIDNVDKFVHNLYSCILIECGHTGA